MTPTDPFAEPSPSKLALAFAIGFALGVAAVFPVIRDDVAASSLGDPGPVGIVLVVGVLSVAVVTTGLFALYQLFWLVDR